MHWTPSLCCSCELTIICFWSTWSSPTSAYPLSESHSTPSRPGGICFLLSGILVLSCWLFKRRHNLRAARPWLFPIDYKDTTIVLGAQGPWNTCFLHLTTNGSKLTIVGKIECFFRYPKIRPKIYNGNGEFHSSDSICEWPESSSSIIPISDLGDQDWFAKQELCKDFNALGKDWGWNWVFPESSQGSTTPQARGKEAKPSEWNLEIYEP